MSTSDTIKKRSLVVVLGIVFCFVFLLNVQAYDVTEDPKYIEYEEYIAERKSSGKIAFYDTPEEAVQNQNCDSETLHMRNMDQLIKKKEDKNGVLMVYTSRKNASVQTFVVCKIGKEVIDGRTKYYYYLSDYSDETRIKPFLYVGNDKDSVRDCLISRSVSIPLNFNVNKRFHYGVHLFPNIYSLKIEGQEPTEIIPYESNGSTRYFYYYENLKSEKNLSEMEYTIDDFPEYKEYLTEKRENFFDKLRQFFKWLF